MPCEEYRNAVWMCWDGIGKAKALAELNLVRDANNKKEIYRYIIHKRMTKIVSICPGQMTRWRTGNNKCGEGRGT